MKTQSRKPWLDQNGTPLSDTKLKLISKGWNQKTWEEYLSWFEWPLQESQLSPEVYQEMAEKMEESVFSLSASKSWLPDQDSKLYAEALLNKLTPKQKTVLKMIFWEEKTEREIAAHLGIARGTVNDIKNRALLKLKSSLAGSTPYLRKGNDNRELSLF